MVKSDINVKRILKINAQILQSIVPDLEANKKKHSHTGIDEFSDQINDRVLAIIAIKTYW